VHAVDPEEGLAASGRRRRVAGTDFSAGTRASSPKARYTSRQPMQQKSWPASETGGFGRGRPQSVQGIGMAPRAGRRGPPLRTRPGFAALIPARRPGQFAHGRGDVARLHQVVEIYGKRGAEDQAEDQDQVAVEHPAFRVPVGEAPRHAGRPARQHDDRRAEAADGHHPDIPVAQRRVELAAREHRIVVIQDAHPHHGHGQDDRHEVAALPHGAVQLVGPGDVGGDDGAGAVEDVERPADQHGDDAGLRLQAVLPDGGQDGEDADRRAQAGAPAHDVAPVGQGRRLVRVEGDEMVQKGCDRGHQQDPQCQVGQLLAGELARAVGQVERQRGIHRARHHQGHRLHQVVGEE
jgi:hypothetical protein